ncbi:MAG TPA: hypothetical protein VHO84_08905 [Syntrophorhabdaceae bacterium]|nr:hypothetical protein [Syntrophorhabdaceae bacterium]
MMKLLTDKSGVALVLVLMIVVISAGLLSVIMYFALSGSEISGLQRKYETSKEASLGAIDIFTKEIIPKTLQQPTGGLSLVAAALNQGSGIVNAISSDASQNSCFRSKLTSSKLSTGIWANCTADDSSADANLKPDITFKLMSASGSAKPFEVKTKIIDTIAGNSNLSGVLLSGAGVVESGMGTITTMHFPYFYTIQVEGKPLNSTTERANFEVLYAY